MKHTKLLVVALLVALIACLAMAASAEPCSHPYDKVTNVGEIKPSCETQGISYYHCNACGANFEYTTPALGHAFPATPDETKQASCGVDGYNKYTCTRPGCGHVKTVTVPKSGNHTFTATLDDAIAPTCVASGLKATVVCSVCGAKQGPQASVPALGHDFTNVQWVPVSASTCQTPGQLARECTRPGCSFKEYMSAPLVDHKKGENPVLPGRKATCTVSGCTDIYECIWCGKQIGGKEIPATGHNFNGAVWEVWEKPTCITNGKLYRACLNNCGTKEFMDAPKVDHTWSEAILPAKAATCTETGCSEVKQCLVCGKTKGGEVTSALGHLIDDKTGWNWKPGKQATCTADGIWHGTCTRPGCPGVDQKVPAYGHSAVWTIKEWATPSTNGIAVLHCTRCDKDIATQVVTYGGTYPSGTLNTGSSSSTAPATTGTTAKTTTTKSTKTTSAKSASTASTKAAAAPATETKKVATVAAAPAALEANQAQLVADKHLYVVKNVAGEEIVLTVNVVDGKITVEAKLAEGESLVLYANAEAIENPTAENTLVLTANEAVELPEAFANAIVAVVKTESLPTAVAAK